ncbi:MAG: hypothetical protein CBE24_03245 [bacterium TMED264]|nr:MAG: hypothetical protein CBE24_03245 [bacterium TMED264]
MLLSVIIPIRNEILYIPNSFESIILACLKIESEILFVDGQSDDGTYEWIKNEIKQIDNCKLFQNEKKIVSHGFNQVFNKARGQYISRIDGHSVYPETYFSDAIDIFNKHEVDVVGGPANHIGIGWKGKVIASCMMHPFGVGNSKFRISNKEQYVDTVPFPIYKRKVLERVGLYDTELIKNQDDELNFRCVEKGFRIYMSPKLKTNYLVRENLMDLSKQYFLYGFYKPLVFKKVGYGARIYHFAPASHFIFSVLFFALLILNQYAFLYFFCYLMFSFIFSIKKNRSVKSTFYSIIVFLSIHYSYGIGFLLGYYKRMHKFFSKIVLKFLRRVKAI